VTRSTLAIFFGLVLLLVLIFAGFVWLRGVDETPSVQSRDIVTDRLAPDATENIDLYFPGQDHALYRESREVPATRSRIALLRQVVEGVLAGPTSTGLFPPLPAGVRLVGVHLNDAGAAYIERDPATHLRRPCGYPARPHHKSSAGGSHRPVRGTGTA